MSIKKYWHQLIMTVLITGVAFLLPLFYNETVAYAFGNPTITIHNVDGGGKMAHDNIMKSDNEILKDFITIENTSNNDGWLVTLNMEGYAELKGVEKRDLMKSVLGAINDSGLNTQARLKLYNFVAKQDESTSSLVRQLSDDVNADFATAYTWFRPFTGGISTVLGIITLAIFSCLGIMIILDLSYISVPMFAKLIDAMGGDKENKSADGKPKMISNEAYRAIKDSQTTTEYKSTIGLYFKYKAFQMAILSICLLYLAGGKIYTFVAWIIDSFSGIIG